MTTLHRASQCRPTCTCAAGCGAHWGSWRSHRHAADSSCVMEANAHCYLSHAASLTGSSGEICLICMTVMLVPVILHCKMLAFLC